MTAYIILKTPNKTLEDLGSFGRNLIERQNLVVTTEDIGLGEVDLTDLSRFHKAKKEKERQIRVELYEDRSEDRACGDMTRVG